MAETVYGHWWDPVAPEVKLGGQLTWEPLKYPRLSLLDPPHDLWHRSNDRPENFVPLLNGRVAKHGAVTILDSIWGGSHINNHSASQDLLASVVLVGVWLDSANEAFIRRLEIRWPALQAMFHARALRLSPLPQEEQEIRFDISAKRLVWNDGDITAVFHYDARWSTKATLATVSMHPTILLASDKARSYLWWRDHWLVPLNSFVTIVTGIQANPERVEVWEAKDPHGDERDERRITVLSRGIGEHDYDNRQAVALVTAEDIDRNDGGLHDVVSRFRRLEQDHPVFVELLLDTANYPKRPLRNRYLDVVSSLEAYHTQVNGIGPIDEEVYKAQRREVLSAARTANLSKDDLAFLKNWLSPRSFFPLERRLRDLVTEAPPYEPWKVSAQRMAQIRNNIAHGNAEVEEAELQDAYDQAFELARRTTCRELGII